MVIQSKSKDYTIGLIIGIFLGTFIFSLSFVYQYPFFPLFLILPFIFGIILSIWFGRKKYFSKLSWMKIIIFSIIGILLILSPLFIQKLHFRWIATNEIPIYPDFEEAEYRSNAFSEFGMDPRGFSLTFKKIEELNWRKGELAYDEIFDPILNFYKRELENHGWSSTIESIEYRNAPNFSKTICLEKGKKQLIIGIAHFETDESEKDWTEIRINYSHKGSLSCKSRGYK